MFRKELKVVLARGNDWKKRNWGEERYRFAPKYSKNLIVLVDRLRVHTPKHL